MSRPFSLLALTALLLGVVGCATNIKPTASENPPPAEKFSNFNRFELLPIEAQGEAAKQDRALAKIQEEVNSRLKSRLDQWNNKPVTGEVRTLVIQPTIPELKFVAGGARFMAGAMAGSSAVILRTKFIDKETGKVVASPEFYSKASALSGAYSMGGNDNAMLARIANSLATYTLRNYKEALGGPVNPTDVEAATIETD